MNFKENFDIKKLIEKAELAPKYDKDGNLIICENVNFILSSNVEIAANE